MLFHVLSSAPLVSEFFRAHVWFAMPRCADVLYTHLFNLLGAFNSNLCKLIVRLLQRGKYSSSKETGTIDSFALMAKRKLLWLNQRRQQQVHFTRGEKTCVAMIRRKQSAIAKVDWPPLTTDLTDKWMNARSQQTNQFPFFRFATNQRYHKQIENHRSRERLSHTIHAELVFSLSDFIFIFASNVAAFCVYHKPSHAPHFTFNYCF